MLNIGASIYPTKDHRRSFKKLDSIKKSYLILEKLSKTNNIILKFGIRNFLFLLDYHHSNILKFLDKIKESQNLIEIMQTQLTAG